MPEGSGSRQQPAVGLTTGEELVRVHRPGPAPSGWHPAEPIAPDAHLGRRRLAVEEPLVEVADEALLAISRFRPAARCLGDCQGGVASAPRPSPSSRARISTRALPRTVLKNGCRSSRPPGGHAARRPPSGSRPARRARQAPRAAWRRRRRGPRPGLRPRRTPGPRGAGIDAVPGAIAPRERLCRRQLAPGEETVGDQRPLGIAAREARELRDIERAAAEHHDRPRVQPLVRQPRQDHPRILRRYRRETARRRPTPRAPAGPGGRSSFLSAAAQGARSRSPGEYSRTRRHAAAALLDGPAEGGGKRTAVAPRPASGSRTPAGRAARRQNRRAPRRTTPSSCRCGRRPGCLPRASRKPQSGRSPRASGARRRAAAFSAVAESSGPMTATTPSRSTSSATQRRRTPRPASSRKTGSNRNGRGASRGLPCTVRRRGGLHTETAIAPLGREEQADAAQRQTHRPAAAAVRAGDGGRRARGRRTAAATACGCASTAAGARGRRLRRRYRRRGHPAWAGAPAPGGRRGGMRRGADTGRTGRRSRSGRARRAARRHRRRDATGDVIRAPARFPGGGRAIPSPRG